MVARRVRTDINYRCAGRKDRSDETQQEKSETPRDRYARTRGALAEEALHRVVEVGLIVGARVLGDLCQRRRVARPTTQLICIMRAKFFGVRPIARNNAGPNRATHSAAAPVRLASQFRQNRTSRRYAARLRRHTQRVSSQQLAIQLYSAARTPLIPTSFIAPSSSSRARASLRSAVSNPSVNQAKTSCSSWRASPSFP
jgi:hypothetical protein